MNRKQKMAIAVASVSIVALAAACVTASPLKLKTPLYVLRMEQASSKMNFLPTEMNEFIYTTEKGYEMNCNVTAEVARECGIMASGQQSCAWTCIWSTCEDTCPSTCSRTCWGPTICTCATCNTCYTCDQPTCEGHDSCKICSTVQTCGYC